MPNLPGDVIPNRRERVFEKELFVLSSPQTNSTIAVGTVASPSSPRTVEAGPKIPSTQSKPKKQGHFCVWHGLTFGTWMRLLASRPPVHWTSLPRLTSITALSVLNSWYDLWESVLFGGRIARQKVNHPPIFILGHWRSGTTLLHNLMTLDPQFTYPNLYQVMYPGNFLLTERIVTRLTGWVLPATRPMDNIPAGWNLPQEDEMALLSLTLMSPYLMLAHQGDPAKISRYFDLSQLSPDERRRWEDAFLTFVKKLTIRADKPVVLKSPSHTFRIPVLLKMFPDARFVYIYRDPYAVYSSGMHLRRTLFRENGLGKPNFNGMSEEVLQVYSDCIETYERTKHLVPAGRLHEVKFEELEADPLGQMQRVYDALNLGGWKNVEPSIQKELPALNEYRKNSFTMDEETMRLVYSHWQFSFMKYGYPSRLPASDTRPDPRDGAVEQLAG